MREMKSNSLDDALGLGEEPKKQKPSKKNEETHRANEIVEPEQTDPTEHHNPDDPREKNPDKVAEKVHSINVKKEEGYLYFVDKDGDVSRVPAKWNKDPRFLEKVKEDEPLVDRKLEQMQEHFAPKEEPHHDPIPVTKPNIPEFLLDREIIYVDKAVIGTINDSSLAKAHTRFYSNKPYVQTTPEEIVHSATVSSFTASILFESLKAQGTNIILNFDQGEHIMSSVIPRFENDGLQLMWDMKQGNQSEIKEVADKIKAAFVIGEKKDFNKVTINEPKKKVNIIDTEEVEKEEKKINYEIEHLRERWA